MTYKRFDHLCEDAEMIRRSVFMDEQGFKNEIDDTDNTAVHIVLYDGTDPAAVCRYFKDGDCYHIGRVAVMKSYRGRGIGKVIMDAAENEIRKDGGVKVVISAQTRARDFYEKCGYTAFGEIYLDEFCPHIGMYKNLKGL